MTLATSVSLKNLSLFFSLRGSFGFESTLTQRISAKEQQPIVGLQQLLRFQFTGDDPFVHHEAENDFWSFPPTSFPADGEGHTGSKCQRQCRETKGRLIVLTK